MSEPTPEDRAKEVQEALFAGQKIQAIKLYREQTGLGLAEAKYAVEKLETELRASAPERFTAKPKAGCAGLLVAGALIGWWLA